MYFAYLNLGLTAGFMDADRRLFRFGGGRFGVFARDTNSPFGRLTPWVVTPGPTPVLSASMILNDGI